MAALAATSRCEPHYLALVHAGTKRPPFPVDEWLVPSPAVPSVPLMRGGGESFSTSIIPDDMFRPIPYQQPWSMTIPCLCGRHTNVLACASRLCQLDGNSLPLISLFVQDPCHLATKLRTHSLCRPQRARCLHWPGHGCTQLCPTVDENRLFC